MGLSSIHMRDAAELCGAASGLREALEGWRERHPGVRAMHMDPVDLRGEAPLLTIGYRSLYLIATNGHCWSITLRPDEADGLILTEEPAGHGHR